MAYSRLAMLAFACLHTAQSRQVVLCSGLMGMDEAKLNAFSSNCEDYQKRGMISHVSPLLYGLSDAGEFVVSKYGSPAQVSGPEFTHQKLGKGGLGLGVLPTLFCDGTLSSPQACNVPTCLDAADKNPGPLINASIEEALKFGWEGYMIDLEGGWNHYNALMDKWGEALHAHGLQLLLWNTMIDVPSAAHSDFVDGVVSMNTYGGSASSFERIAGGFLNSVPAKKAGFGLITYGSPNREVADVGRWCDEKDVAQIAIWSDQEIPADWESGLRTFLGSSSVVV